MSNATDAGTIATSLNLNPKDTADLAKCIGQEVDGARRAIELQAPFVIGMHVENAANMIYDTAQQSGKPVSHLRALGLAVAAVYPSVVEAVRA